MSGFMSLDDVEKLLRDSGWMSDDDELSGVLPRVIEAADAYAEDADDSEEMARSFLVSTMENKNVPMAERLHAASLLLK